MNCSLRTRIRFVEPRAVAKRTEDLAWLIGAFARAGWYEKVHSPVRPGKGSDGLKDLYHCLAFSPFLRYATSRLNGRELDNAACSDFVLVSASLLALSSVRSTVTTEVSCHRCTTPLF